MNGPSPGSLALGHVGHLHAYVPGVQPSEPGWVKLNTNESPYPPSPAVVAALQGELGSGGASLRLYPNPPSEPLRAALARTHGVLPGQVCVGNGSDDLLNLLARGFCGPGIGAGFLQPSYSLYPVLVAAQNGASVRIPFGRDGRLPVEAVAASPTRIFFLTSPNAPTGVGYANADLVRLLESYPGLLIVDEAYAPFAREDAAGLVSRFPRLVVVRTFSKAYALAGIRVGYALADPSVVRVLDCLRDSYNVSRLSQAAAQAALEDRPHHEALVARIVATRDAYQEKWKEERGWFTFPSQTNFLCTEPRDSRGAAGPEVARRAYDFLFSRKVLVRHFPSDALTASFLRISVGTDEEMLILDQTLDAWLKAPPNA